jgi:hypothetical protein
MTVANSLAIHNGGETDKVFGRQQELAELRSRLLLQESFVLYGAPGSGKTFLLRRLLPSFPRVLYCRDSTRSQSMFHEIATELLRVKNTYALRNLGNGMRLRSKSALAVRGVVLDALHEGNYSAILDHLRCPSAALACDIRDLMNWGNTCVVAVARSEHMEELGYIRSCFALRSERMQLKNFDSKEALAFAEHLAQQTSLYASNCEDFLRKIVELSSGAPGMIATMINMASRPRYRCGDHIKISPLYIDFRLAWHAANAF